MEIEVRGVYGGNGRPAGSGQRCSGASVARVAVAAATYSIDKPYDYLVPESLAEKARPGVRVSVPFGRGNRASEGMILALSQESRRWA